jgi:signal transduction histidine kinase
MFRSARLELTLFYLAVIFLFNLAVTVSIRVIAEHEFIRANSVQRTGIERWSNRVFYPPDFQPDVAIGQIQDNQEAIVSSHLNQSLFLINLGALALGGLLSYWFAGRALRPLQELHEAQARFVADASHELRTPLANMKIENEVFLRQKEPSQEDAHELITSNLEEINRLERLSSNLLALHQYGQHGLALASAAVSDIVEESLAQSEKIAKAKHVTIEQAITPADVLVHRESMVQLLDILIDNALKYGASGKHIAIRGVRHNGRYFLAIQDKGPGIAAADLPRLFDRLYRGDKARSNQIPGYGLGLALAREIAQANNATITARNNKDGGACLELSLELPGVTPAA